MFVCFIKIFITFVQAPEYLLPEGQTASRGSFELAFSTIGSTVIGGGIGGGAYGLYKGRAEIAARGFQSKVARTMFVSCLLFITLDRTRDCVRFLTGILII